MANAETMRPKESPTPEPSTITVDSLIALLGRRQSPQAARKTLKKVIASPKPR